MKAIEDMIEHLRSKPEYLEFEARLGYYKGHFVTNVGESFFNRIHDWVAKCPDITQTEKTEHHDFTYIHNGERLRTRVIFDAMDMNMKKHTVYKQRIKDVTLNAQNGSGLCTRIQLSSETPYLGTLPSVTSTEHMRIVQRKSYTIGPWRYDFSKVCEGKNRMEAEENKENCKFHYEIECELVDLSYLKTRNNEYVAESTLLKMTDLANTDWILT